MKKHFGLMASLFLVGAGTARADGGLPNGGAAHKVKQAPPVQMGTSGGSLDDHSKAFCCGGTLGSAVNYNGALHILSNNHILARSGSAVAGEHTLQPGLIDFGCNGAASNFVGTFIGNVVPLGTANVDVGLSLARTGQVAADGAILDIGVPCDTIQAPAVGLAVKKSGRTTGLTTGNIISINTSVSIRYQKGCNSGKKFVVSYANQIVTGAMSAGGDSGSLLVTDSAAPHPVGLLYAGSSSTTIYNPIQDVANALGNSFSFVGVACGDAASGAVAARPSDDDLGAALRIKVENENEILHHPGVLGVGVGAAENDPEEAAIVVLFESRGAVPKTLPTELDGAKVRVILTDTIVAQ